MLAVGGQKWLTGGVGGEYKCRQAAARVENERSVPAAALQTPSEITKLVPAPRRRLVNHLYAFLDGYPALSLTTIFSKPVHLPDLHFIQSRAAFIAANYGSLCLSIAFRSLLLNRG